MNNINDWATQLTAEENALTAERNKNESKKRLSKKDIREINELRIHGIILNKNQRNLGVTT